MSRFIQLAESLLVEENAQQKRERLIKQMGFENNASIKQKLLDKKIGSLPNIEAFKGLLKAAELHDGENGGGPSARAWLLHQLSADADILLDKLLPATVKLAGFLKNAEASKIKAMVDFSVLVGKDDQAKDDAVDAMCGRVDTMMLDENQLLRNLITTRKDKYYPFGAAKLALSLIRDIPRLGFAMNARGPNAPEPHPFTLPGGVDVPDPNMAHGGWLDANFSAAQSVARIDGNWLLGNLKVPGGEELEYVIDADRLAAADISRWIWEMDGDITVQQEIDKNLEAFARRLDNRPEKILQRINPARALNTSNAANRSLAPIPGLSPDERRTLEGAVVLFTSTQAAVGLVKLDGCDLASPSAGGSYLWESRLAVSIGTARASDAVIPGAAAERQVRFLAYKKMAVPWSHIHMAYLDDLKDSSVPVDCYQDLARRIQAGGDWKLVDVTMPRMAQGWTNQTVLGTTNDSVKQARAKIRKIAEFGYSTGKQDRKEQVLVALDAALAEGRCLVYNRESKSMAPGMAMEGRLGRAANRTREVGFISSKDPDTIYHF